MALVGWRDAVNVGGDGVDDLGGRERSGAITASMSGASLSVDIDAGGRCCG